MRTTQLFGLCMLGATGVAMALALGGCVGSTTGGNADDGARPSDAARSYPLDSLPTSTVTIGDNVFRVWVASELATLPPGVVTTAVQEGLMHVTPAEIADDQAMLFVFTDERVRGFWMLNTITPLEGKSLLPVFQGKEREPHEVLYWEHMGNRAIRQGKWKLVARKKRDWELYDLEADRTELEGLALKYPEKAEELSGLYDAWAARTGVK